MIIFELTQSKLTTSIISLVAEGNINDVLIKTLAEAHANTNPKLEYVHEMFRKPQVNQRMEPNHSQRIITYFSGLYLGSISNSSLQEYGPGGIVVGLC